MCVADEAKLLQSRRNEMEAPSRRVSGMTEPGKWRNATWPTSGYFRKVPHPAWKRIQYR